MSGKKIRPTADRTREAIFNIIAPDIEGAVVLDLFAGTGAFGLEALSRGAEFALFIDIDGDCIRLLQHNIRSVGVAQRADVLQWDLAKNLNCLHSLQYRYDLVFMDPPYGGEMIATTLAHLLGSHSLQSGACLIAEHSRHEPDLQTALPITLSDQRRYGKTLVSFFHYVV
jgi:16S rRNA (guanine966-N2)-methyltransferase